MNNLSPFADNPSASVGRHTRTWQAVAHLAALTPIPLGSILGPAVVSLIKSNCAPVVAEARKALNFQISALIYLVALIWLPWLCLITLSERGLEVWVSRFAVAYGVGFTVLVYVCPIAWVTLVVMAAVAAHRGRPFRYPLSMRFIDPPSDSGTRQETAFQDATHPRQEARAKVGRAIVRWVAVIAGLVCWPVITIQLGRLGSLLPGRWARFEGWLYFTSCLYLLAGAYLLASGVWRRRAGGIAVGALVLLLMPAWGCYRESATWARCFNNLGALHTGMAVYQMKHDGRFPDAAKWADEIYPYLMRKDWGTFKCPDDLSAARCSYAFNTRLSGKRSSEIADPSHTVVLYETTAPGDNPSGTGETLPRRLRHRWPRPGSQIRFNNFLFAYGGFNPDHPVKWHW